MELKDNKTGKQATYKTDFSIELTKKYILVTFIAHSSKFNSYSDKYNDEIYKGDVCELFLATSKNKNRYYEIEVAPNNTAYLAEIYNNNGVLEHYYIEENFLTTNVVKDKDTYKATISIPLEKLKYTSLEDFYFNAFRIETDGGEIEKYLFAFNPTLCGSFHKPEFFVKLLSLK